MNAAEARHIAEDIAAELHQLDYERLRVGYGDRPRCRVIFGRGGVTYQVEVRAEPEDDHGRELRVAVTVDDGDHDLEGLAVEQFLVSADERHVTAATPSP